MGINRKTTPLAVARAAQKLARHRRRNGERRSYVGARKIKGILAQIALEN